MPIASSVGEVEDLLEIGADLEQLARRQGVDVEALPLCRSRQIGDDTRMGQAEVEDRKAVRRVEPAPAAATAVAAARVKALGLVSASASRTGLRRRASRAERGRRTLVPTGNLAWMALV